METQCPRSPEQSISLRSFEQIRNDYRFGEEEEAILRSLKPLVEPQVDQLVEDFSQLLLDNPETAKFLPSPETVARVNLQHRQWLLNLFGGPYNEAYFHRLERVGLAHVRLGLSAHFIYVAMNFLRERLTGIVSREVEPAKRRPALEALEKILDLNLDIIARAYHQAELRRYFLSYRLDDALIRFARRFTFALNFMLLLGLIGLALGMMAVLINDIAFIFLGHFDKGLVAALGSLLVLWLAIELLEAEIDRLRGGELQLSLFVGVALVAFIRKVLIATLSHEDIKMELVYLGGIFIFGIIYWLLSRREVKR